MDGRDVADVNKVTVTYILRLCKGIVILQTDEMQIKLITKIEEALITIIITIKSVESFTKNTKQIMENCAPCTQQN